MDRIDIAAVKPDPAPMHIADRRPTADAAAVARNPRPETPLPIGPTQALSPTSTSQNAAVSRSMMLATGVEEADKTRAVAAPTDMQRTLKPYGIRMLPEGPETASKQQEVSQKEQQDQSVDADEAP